MTPIKGILGEKLGMTQIFEETRAVPVTVIKAGPCFVAQVKTKETDGYDAVQLAFAEAAPNKPMQGHFDAHGGQVGRHLVELRTEDASSYTPGQELRADVFAAGERADVVGVSRGKGFSGVMRRHGFAGLGSSHGTEKKHRSPGSIGACATPSRVFKGMRMAGQHGNQRITVLNLEVVQADAGAQPDPRQGRRSRPERRARHGADPPSRLRRRQGRAPDGLHRAPRRAGQEGRFARPSRPRVRVHGERAADAPGRDGRARRASAPGRTPPRPAATSPAAGRSRGGRRAPAAPVRARSVRPNGWAAASRTDRTRTRTRCA